MNVATGRPGRVGSGHEIVASLGLVLGATLVVTALATFLPRQFMVNDDQTITGFLRENTRAPLLAPLLSQTLGALYAAAPERPWFGLWLYLVYAVALALGARVLVDLPGGAPAALRRALHLGASVMALGIAMLPVRGVTFTTAAVGACGLALVGFAAEVLRTAQGEPDRPLRHLACGLVFALGMATRLEAPAAAGVATAPLLLAAAAGALRARRRPRLLLFVPLLGPALALHTLGWVVPQCCEPDARRYLAFAAECGALQLRPPFVDLDRRAPEVLGAAGWDPRHYRRFARWVYLDEAWYTTERLRALRETGGLPGDLEPGAAISYARSSAGYAFPLLVAAILAAGALALSGLGSARAVAVGLVHLAVFVVAAAMLQRWLRFPARVAVPMSLVAAVAVWVAVRADCDPARWAQAGSRLRARPLRAAAAALALALAVVFAFQGLARTLPRATALPVARLELEKRLLARNPALVVVHAQAGWSRDPLRARPRDYPHLSLDWDIFSVPFYGALRRIGATRGADLASRAVDDEHVYFLAERRFQADLAGMVKEDAAGARLLVVDRTGPTSDDLVLLRAVRATGESRP